MASNGTYPNSTSPSLVNLGGLSGQATTTGLISPYDTVPYDADPSALTAAVLTMLPRWDPIETCLGGTRELRLRSTNIIPREPREDDAAYQRRIFHATMPPFLTRLASQAAGLILRKGIDLDYEGPNADDAEAPGGESADAEAVGDWWDAWAEDVTGDGTTLNEYARSWLLGALLYGHRSTIVDFNGSGTAPTLAAERAEGARPYLVPVEAPQIRGWRLANDSWSSDLTQVRIREVITEPQGAFGETLVEQIRVMTPGAYQLWRQASGAPGSLTAANAGAENAGWVLHRTGTTSLSRVPLVTVYSNRLGNLLSAPPLLEVAYLNIAYAQRFCDYHHAIHVGANPMLTLQGFDPDSDAKLGLSVNTAILLPIGGDAKYVEPTSAAYDSQLRCLDALESQISRLGINTLTQANLTNAAAESKRLDRIDSDSIMATIAGDLERAITEVVTIAAEYMGIPAPRVSIPRDYENRLIDGNQITAYLQLFMQGAITQETLLTILQQGEVLPPTVDISDEVATTRDHLAEETALRNMATNAPATTSNGGPDLAFQASGGSTGSTTGGNVGQGESLTSQTLPTPLRPGRQ